MGTQTVRLVILAINVVSITFLGGCSTTPNSGLLLQQALSKESIHTVAVELHEIAPAESDRFTINCPYEIAKVVSRRLDVDANEMPDYSLDEGRNAIIFATGNRVSALVELKTLDVDLCHDASEFGAVYPTNGELVFERSADGSWSLTGVPRRIDK